MSRKRETVEVPMWLLAILVFYLPVWFFAFGAYVAKRMQPKHPTAHVEVTSEQEAKR